MGLLLRLLIFCSLLYTWSPHNILKMNVKARFSSPHTQCLLDSEQKPNFSSGSHCPGFYISNLISLTALLIFFLIRSHCLTICSLRATLGLLLPQSPCIWFSFAVFHHVVNGLLLTFCAQTPHYPQAFSDHWRSHGILPFLVSHTLISFSLCHLLPSAILYIFVLSPSKILRNFLVLLCALVSGTRIVSDV